MRFTTHENLIDLLVGQSLYSNPDVAMRELLQNAEDACQLQSFVDESFVPEIVVRYSVSGSWVEVSDNGLGMDLKVFEESFTTVGASKSTSPKMQALLARAGSSRPIGQFGIGVLSCFGVADIVEVRSKSEGDDPIAFRIRDRRLDFEDIPPDRTERGTSLRLMLKPGGPMNAASVPAAVSRYVRHARHIWLEEVDQGKKSVVNETWLEAGWSSSSAITDGTIESGYLQLSEAWDNINQGFDTHLVLCNGGFLVTERAVDALPEYALGFRAEVNLRPGALTILMNREGFQQDERWKAFTESLTSHYRQRVVAKLASWLADPAGDGSTDRKRAMQRAVLLVLRSPMREVLGGAVLEQAQQLLPWVLIPTDTASGTLDSLIEKAKAKPPLYVEASDQQAQVQRSFSDGGQQYLLTETIRTTDLRVALLRANGFAVTRADRHDFSVNFGNKTRNIQIHDFDVLTDYCNSLGVVVERVINAPAEHTKLGTSAEAEAVSSLIQLTENLKIQSVASMSEPIISDYNGYILNAANPEVRRILNVLPDAVGNPIRKKLLEMYFALSTYSFLKARDIVFELITDPDFDNKTRQTTGRYLRDHLRARVKRLVVSEEPGDV